MNRITPERLGELATVALERTCFLLVGPGDRAGPAGDLVASVGYDGPSAGRVWVAASGPFAVELAACLLGVAPEEIDADTDGRDAVRELANIVGGLVVLELGGADHRFTLGLPVESPLDARGLGSEAALESETGSLRVVWDPAAHGGRHAA